MVRVLSVSDEVVDSLNHGAADELAPDLIIGAGDLPFDYLEKLMARFGVPCVFVPGNHDRDLTGYKRTRSGWTQAGLPVKYPGPEGAVNADGRIVTVAGVRVAGLGGCIRYNDGPNQYREAAQRQRANRLALRRFRHRVMPGQGAVDILLTHSPARGIGDAEDGPHRGFKCFLPLIYRLRPQVLLHGHIHPHGQTPMDHTILLKKRIPGQTLRRSTMSINTVGYCLFDIEPGGSGVEVHRRRHGA
ncbi:metallophosphoesterase [Williamsia sp. 1138]|uniref:Metallophosphoesterase n=1 Tax=Gordonia rubripertincta TaxID=36822 RepID=A0ABT4N0Z9_GORRU|nr:MULTISPECIES: metallophosphoesterase [Mycobacteriales]MCZ4552921.1 metallophosphoesterase [Gordonia rubripertincta]OZG30339.1 metallophosphoesterase [Williamsia sp. 1138]